MKWRKKTKKNMGWWPNEAAGKGGKVAQTTHRE